DVSGFRRLVLESDLDALVQVTDYLEPLLDNLGLELDLGKDRRIRMEINARACAAGGAELLQTADRFSLTKSHFPLRAIAFDRRDQLFRQRVDHARADAMQPAGGFVIAVLELAAGMQDGEDDFNSALLGGRMLVDRNPPPVILDGDGGSIRMKRHPNV